MKKFFAELWRRLKLVDFIGAALAILKAARKQGLEVDPKLIVVKPRILSDENLLRAVSAVKAALVLYPPAAVIGGAALGLGEMGFKIWKRISLSRDYDELAFPPVDPNMLRLSIEMDQELKRHYGTLAEEAGRDDEALSELEAVYNDFQFITDPQMLKAKYPQVDSEYIEKQAASNRKAMGRQLDVLEQSLLAHSMPPEVEHNIRDAFGYVRDLFPVMNDWALFNSDGFDDLLEIVDTIL
jgi:hypothetical protein